MKHIVNFWKQSSGRTGQCKTENINNLFERVAPLYEKKIGLKLSKERLYDLALQKARQGKQAIMNAEQSKATFTVPLYVTHRKEHVSYVTKFPKQAIASGVLT